MGVRIGRRTKGRMVALGCTLAAVIALVGGTAVPAAAETDPGIDNTAPATGCPVGWGQVEIRPPIDTVFVCARPGGNTYLFNDSDQVWNIADYDTGKHVVTTVFQTKRSALFRTTFAWHFDHLGLAAPRDVVRLPDYYHDVRISPHQNLTVAWNQQIELETAVVTAARTAATDLLVSGSLTRKALVKCATAAWGGVKGAKNVWEATDVQTLITNGLTVAGGATGCKRAINAASEVKDSRALTIWDDQITAANKAIKQGEAAKNTAVELFELINKYFR